ncbi:hypothetical protein AALO_G00109250 [Alosa alosa]|uniref:SUN domain-containing protein n=1 Tax=Alosa alosa TaxID=278164 RepID=A0AAV6GV02_9TELE|nr:SUN domain-containing protein 2-like isoform X1 [Alosa alosa]KAG5276746.1 hypothetical protein AALO_G00109250 [Alosa alosa]
MPRCKKPSNHNERCETDSSHTSVSRNGDSALTLEHLRTHTHPYTAHCHPSTSEPIAGLAATRRHTFCCFPKHTHSAPSSSSSSTSHSVDHDSDSSSSDSDYRGSCNRTAPISYWLARVLRKFIDFTVDLGRSLSSLWFPLPLNVLLLRGDYHPHRRKALTVAGLTLLGLGCWFCVPILFQQPSGSVNTASGINLAKIQEQVIDIQKQLTDKEARWKETLLKEMGSLQFKVELSKWLQEHLFTGSNPSVVLWPELQVVLESMEKRLVQSLATSPDVHKTVQETLNQYRADGTGMADYALIYSGGKVIKSHYIKPYCPQSLQLQTEGPSAVIQPEVYPGKCWAFRGSYSSVTITLSHSVRITHVTMEHLPKCLSPTGQIDSAPQDFAIYGIDHVDQHQEGVFIGKFAYNKDGDPIQTFALKDPVQNFYPVVELRILTNWGNPSYTCVYRFRVHGQLKNV